MPVPATAMAHVGWYEGPLQVDLKGQKDSIAREAMSKLASRRQAKAKNFVRRSRRPCRSEQGGRNPKPNNRG